MYVHVHVHVYNRKYIIDFIPYNKLFCNIISVVPILGFAYNSDTDIIGN